MTSDTSSTLEAGTLFQRQRWRIFLTVSGGVFMCTLDSSMVNIALPSIMDFFHSPLATVKWVVMGYLLTTTATLLFWGHLSDRFGHRTIYTTGLLLFALGAFAGWLAPGLLLIIAARFLQAAGAAMVMATGPAIIRYAFPREELGRTLGFVGVAVSLGLMSGPTLGGLLIQYTSWRAMFLFSALVGGLVAIVAAMLIHSGPAAATHKRIDWLGGILWALSLTCFTIAMSKDSGNLSTTIFLSLFFVTLLVFVRLEVYIPQPLLPLGLFRRWFFTAGIISAVISFSILYAAIIMTPFFLNRVLGLTGVQMGVVMLAVPLATMTVSPLSGWLSDFLGDRILSSLGLVVSSCGLLLMSTFTEGERPMTVGLKLFLVGAGQALFLSPNSASILSRVESELSGTASAMLATARNFGMLLGTAMSGLIFSLYFRRLTGGLDMKDFTPELNGPFLIALRHVFWAGSATGMVGAIVSWIRGTAEVRRKWR